MAGLITRIGRVAAVVVALLVLSLGGGARADAWQPDEDDQLLLELRSGQYRLGETLRGYQTPGGVCVDFADLVQALDLPVRIDRKSRRATGWFFAEDQRFLLDRDAGTVQTASGPRAIPPGAVRDTPEGWCIDLTALSGWMGVRLEPDLGNLAVVIHSERKLPFLEAIERKSRAARLRRPGVNDFDLAQLPQAELPYRAWRAPSVDVQIAAQTSRAGGADAQYEVLGAGEILGLSYSARLSGSVRAARSALRLRAYRNDPVGGLLGPLHATQLALGDVESPRGGLTAQSAYGRGTFVSNRPINLPSRFGATSLRGIMPAGWDAELYRNGELRAYQGDRGDGRYAFDQIELLFGENDFDVVLHGPQGQIRHERTSVPVGGEAIPPGKTWYWAGIVEQGRDLFEFTGRPRDPLTGWRWGIGVERGIDRRTSAGLEYQSLMLAGRRRDYLEATLRRSLGGMLIETSAAQQLGTGRALSSTALGKVGAVRFDARVLWVDGDFDSELVRAQQGREFSLRLGSTMRLGGWRLPVEASVRQTRGRGGRDVTEWQARGSFRLARASFTAELLHRTITGPDAAGGAEAAGTKLALIGHTTFGPARLRGSARFRLGRGGNGGERHNFEQVEAVLEAPLGTATTVRAGYRFDAPAARHEYSFGYVRQFERFALRADARTDSRGQLGLGLTLAFSLGRDPVDGGWRASRSRLAETGQAAIEVFRDDNGDGYRQIGEVAVPGVTLEAGFRRSDKPTNAAGRAMIDGLQAYVPVLVTIDSASLPDPLLQPKGRGMVVVPRPGVQARLVLPLAPTGEVEAILLGADGEPCGGASVELTDPAGRVILRATSDFDGYVLFDSVPYGDYRLRLGVASAGALGFRQAVGGALRIDQARSSLRLGRVRLELAPMPAQVASGGS